jgi:hypothetical protein
MTRIVYGIAFLLIVTWVVVFFGFNAGNWAYLFLVMGLIFLLVNVIIEG